MNSNKPRIAISLRIVKSTTYDETRDALSHDWPKFLEDMEMVPIYIPNNLTDVKKYVSDLQINGLILSGGDSLGQDPIRDKTEKILLEFAISKKIPVLGVCRGLQLINEYFGGDLTENNTDSHIGSKHILNIVDKNFKKILNSEKINTNSFHSNTIHNSNLSEDLKIIAVHAVDNTIEAVSHPTLPIIGVMWHPERNSENFDMNIMNSLFKKNIF